MAHDYCIWIVTPPGNAHAAAFHEIALGLQGGLRELGLQAPVVQDKRHIRGKAIVLGANLLPEIPHVKPPGKAILFNLEQITPGSEWLTADYLKLLKRHTVWDYSRYNIEQLRQLVFAISPTVRSVSATRSSASSMPRIRISISCFMVPSMHVAWQSSRHWPVQV